MKGCPKCSSSSISGPIYYSKDSSGSESSGSEVLQYVCLQCGYTEESATHDQVRQQAEVADVRTQSEPVEV